MRKRLFFLFLLLFIFSSLICIFRIPVLRSCATFLIREEPLQQADALFVLSGGAFDRGNEAVKIFQNGYTPKIICTGANPVADLKVFDIDTLESDMAVANLKRQGVPDSFIVEIKEGTSTREEAMVILNYCRQKNLKRIIVLSSKLHTRRVNEVFREQLNQVGIELIVRGAPSSRFDEMKWWKSEDGLIAVNNEWLKTIYYWWKY